MIIYHARNLLLSAIVLLCGFTYAAEDADHTVLLPPAPVYGTWAFSGVVSNESGDNYGYLFEMKREGDNFKAMTVLFDAQTKKIVFSEESEAVIAESTPYNWRIGPSFLRFNAITNSWVFGLKLKDNKGFNFKVDMLKRSDSLPVVQSVRPGIQLLANQATHLNGHIQIDADEKEEFVTAKNAWFRQIWFVEHYNKPLAFSGILCQFNDGKGFYSLKMNDKPIFHLGMAKWFEEPGVSNDIPQFVTIKQNKPGYSDIYLTSPKLHLVLGDDFKNNWVTAGFVTTGKPGFCVLLKEELGTKNA
jgi:hypothetical protein